MKKRILGLLSLFVLSSCSDVPLESVSTSPEESNTENDTSVAIPSESSEAGPQYNDVTDPTEGLLYLEAGLRPVFASDKQGFKVSQKEDEPLMQFAYMSKSDITVDSGEEDDELKEYTIELFDDDAKVEFFNCTKKNQFKSRSVFDKANLVVDCEGDNVLSLTQSYKLYLDESTVTTTNDDGTSKTSTVKGAYLDLSKAKLSKTIISNILDIDGVSDYNYFNLSTLFTIIDYFLPLSDALTRLLPSIIDFLEERIEGDYGFLKATEDEHYWLSAGIENKEELQTAIEDMIDDSFDNNIAGRLIKVVLQELFDLYLDRIDTFNANFDIFYSEGEIEKIDLSINFKPTIKTDDEGNVSTSASFVGDGFKINASLTFLSGDDIDQTSYPTNLTDRTIWKQLSYTSFLL